MSQDRNLYRATAESLSRYVVADSLEAAARRFPCVHQIEWIAKVEILPALVAPTEEGKSSEPAPQTEEPGGTVPPGETE